jgi:hypothetical protein
MAVFNSVGWPVRLLIAALVAAGIGTGAFFLVRSGRDSEQPSVLVATPSATAKVTQVVPTATRTPEATEVPTQPAQPTEAPPTALPQLPPPPPRPNNPTPVEDATIEGGQWYVFQQCLSFYLPSGYTFAIHLALNDPGGYLTVAFEVEGAGSAVVFLADDVTVAGRTVLVAELEPVFDQIAATISRDC